MDFWKLFAGIVVFFFISFLKKSSITNYHENSKNKNGSSFLDFFSRSQNENLLWKERDLCVYILNVACTKVEGMRSAPEYKQVKYSKSNFKYLCDIAALMLKYFINDMPNIINDTDIEMAHAAVDCLNECLRTATVLYQRKFTDFLKILRKCFKHNL